jgi:prepilin-type N-terminal cleavage/methylation domain-containing protein
LHIRRNRIYCHQFNNIWRKEMRACNSLKSRKSQKGFTLVELSIVLVIIGLIVASVLTGQDLVAAATVRSLVQQKDTYDTAVFSFRAKYNALPGDGATPSLAACSGNGDGKLALGSVAVIAATTGTGGAAANTGDSACFWKILGQGPGTAGYLPGTFSGAIAVQGSTANAAIQPTSKLGNMWGAYFSEATFASNAYVLGANYTAGLIQGTTASVDNNTAVNMDTKVDDGKSNTGTIVALTTSAAFAATTNDGTLLANYTGNTASLALIMKMQGM